MHPPAFIADGVQCANHRTPLLGGGETGRWRFDAIAHRKTQNPMAIPQFRRSSSSKILFSFFLPIDVLSKNAYA